jgi:hypothetical protein
VNFPAPAVAKSKRLATERSEFQTAFLRKISLRADLRGSW